MKKVESKIPSEEIPWMLKEDAYLYKSIYHYSPLCLAFSDTRGNIIRVNKKYCELVGYREEELLGMGFGELTSKDQMKKEIEGVRAAIHSGSDFFRIEKKMTHKQGHLIWVDVSMTIVRKENNEVAFIIAMLNNITDRVQMAQALKKSEEALQKQNSLLEEKVAERTRELHLKNRKLENSNKDLEAFAYAASHDLKEPLRTIGGFTSLLRKKYEKQFDEAGKEYLDFIVQGVGRMDSLIKSILDYSKVRQADLELEEVTIRKIIEVKLQDLAQKIHESNAKITIGALPESVYCIGEQIGIVFYNLISNGLKFNENAEPAVKIFAKEEEANWIFYVEDNGIGLDMKYQDQIFQLFKRLHNKDEYEGSGVGLALCHKIIERHGGQISLDSSPTTGTTFYFSLPKNS